MPGEKKCPDCGHVNAMDEFLCRKCRYRFYAAKEKRTRRTREEINAAILAKKKEAEAHEKT